MDYCKIHFGKTLMELKFEDIQNFFSIEKTETNQLEFKSFAGNVSDNYPGLIKTICGFLNSKGGLLIWGAPKGEKRSSKNEKIFSGDLAPITQLIVKDQCISKCSDSISPLPVGIRLNVISKDNNCLCVFEIDESDYAPHQMDNVYYMRIDGQTKPAPHHYVEALFKKIKNPLLEGYLKFNEAELVSGILKIHLTVLLFNWTPMQNVEEISYRLSSDNGIFSEKYIPDYHINNMREFRAENFKNVLHFGEPAVGIHTIAVNLSKFRDITIVLSFGGRNTSAKSSKYKFSLGNMSLSNIESNLIERKENLSYKELQDSMGVTRESTLKGLLNRK
jgi:hypothetical protein